MGKFISCDWGTSNIRLSIVDRDTLKIYQSYNSSNGIKDTYKLYTQQTKLSQKDIFSKTLIQELNQLSQYHKSLPIVISGMASSSIGMCEMPYAKMPIKGNGDDLLHEQIVLNEDITAIMVSGARSENGVMRGEEVQAIGLFETLKSENSDILLLPGTHSKHINTNYEGYANFSTYMTGELFQIIAKQSILSKSINKVAYSDDYEADFMEGLHAAINDGMAVNLFSIRVNDLLARKDKESNYFYLSGLLIGEEVKYLKNSGSKVCLAASGSLNKLYKIALQLTLPEEQVKVLDEKAIQNATLIGQKKILDNYG